MKQTDIYTEALTCLRSILLADHPEFQNWIDWLERDIEEPSAVRSPTTFGHTEAWVPSTTYPVCVEIMTIFSAFSSPCAMPSAIFMANGKAFLRRH